jgi:hypothetical protein
MGKVVDVGNVPRDAPIRLSTAARLAFPDGAMTVSGLRREALRGRLVVERIAGKDFTTLANIDHMRELCRVQTREPDCSSATHVSKEKSLSLKPSGSSKMAADISPRDALRTRLKQSHQKLPNKH